MGFPVSLASPFRQPPHRAKANPITEQGTRSARTSAKKQEDEGSSPRLWADDQRKSWRCGVLLVALFGKGRHGKGSGSGVSIIDHQR